VPRVPDSRLATLKRRAQRAASLAYAPYSGFAVGAAVLTDKGEIFAGANVENVSYGLSMCAERNAIQQAAAHGARRIAAIVVYTPTSQPTPPCGACRQVLAEFGSDTLVLCCSKGGEIRRHHLRELLPDAFGAHDIGLKRTVSAGGASARSATQHRKSRRRRS